MMAAASQRSQDRFANTRWSMVMHQAGGDAPDASRALDELAQRYWCPVYAYVRRCGHAPAIAQDITRTFLHRLIDEFRSRHEQPPHVRGDRTERAPSYPPTRRWRACS